jgi:hypothetical protein
MNMVKICWIYEKLPKIERKGFWSTDLRRRGHILLGHAVHKGRILFSSKQEFMGTKRYRIERRYENINFPY